MKKNKIIIIFICILVIYFLYISLINKNILLPTGVNGSIKTLEVVDNIIIINLKQYELLQLSIIEDGGFLKFENRYLVKMASYYATYIGRCLDITLDGGQILYVIIGDIKKDIDTDYLHQYSILDNSILEFIISDSNINYDYINEIFYGSIIKISEASN